MTTIYLVPCILADDALETIPAYVLEAVKECQVIFAENERTARRFLKAMDKSIVIDNFEWFAIHKAEEEQLKHFRQKIKEQKNIAIISEAGCPGVADPGQVLVAAAQDMKCHVKPLVGPSSILLALMASGMNGQQFEFVGYLPIDNAARIKKIKELETSSAKNITCSGVHRYCSQNNLNALPLFLVPVKTAVKHSRLAKCTAAGLFSPVMMADTGIVPCVRHRA